MRFNEKITRRPIDVSWATQAQIAAEPEYLGWLSIAQALEQGRDLTHYFIEQVIDPELREDPRTRINGERAYVREGGAAQVWHVDYPPGYELHQKGQLGYLAWGVGRATELCGPIEISDVVARDPWGSNFHEWVGLHCNSGLPIQQIPTGTYLETDQPFVHRGSAVFATGWRYFNDVWRA